MPLALAILLGCLGGSAQATVIGVERVVASTFEDSSPVKNTTATCPAGKRVVGAGADVTPGVGSVLINEIRPDSGLTSVFVQAYEDETGTAANWFVAAWAICAYPPPGLELVSAASATTSAGKGVVATCPAGKRVLGAAGGMSGAPGQLLLDGIKPDSGLTTVTVNAYEDQTGTAASWTVTAHAICANPVAGLQRLFATSAASSSQNRVQTKPCPAGRQLLGIAGEINSSNAQVVLDAIYTTDATASTAGFAAWEDATGNPANWSVTVYAICAITAQRITETGTEVNGYAGAAIDCPAGQELTGGGAEIIGGFGQAFLQAFGVMLDAITSLGTPVSAYEDATGTSNAWSVRGHAICATPLPGNKTVESVLFASESTSPQIRRAVCPSGTRVVGTGADIFGERGEAMPTNLIPNAGLQSVDLVAHRYAGVGAADFAPAVMAYCAPPPPGLQRVVATSPTSDDEVKSVTATCPAGKHVLGTGGGILPGSGNVMIDDVRPDAALKGVTVTGMTTDVPPIYDWSVTAYAICATS